MRLKSSVWIPEVNCSDYCFHDGRVSCAVVISAQDSEAWKHCYANVGKALLSRTRKDLSVAKTTFEPSRAGTERHAMLGSFKNQLHSVFADDEESEKCYTGGLIIRSLSPV